MTSQHAGAAVIQFYETHPINEAQILHALEARGVALPELTEDILKDHDQDHFGGVEANDVLAPTRSPSGSRRPSSSWRPGR